MGKRPAGFGGAAVCLERRGKWMKKIQMVYVLTVCACMTAAVMSAACGKKTVNPPDDPGTLADTGSTEAESESGWSDTAQEGGTETETYKDQLAGGSVGEADFEVIHQEKQYEAEDGTVIFEVKIAYPVFAGEGEGIRAINHYYEEWKNRKLEEYESDINSTRQFALEVYRESKDDGWREPWWEEYQVSGVRTWNGYVSVLVDSYLYEGGAHGMPYREGQIFHLESGREAKLTDLADLSQEAWEKLLRARFAEKIAEGGEGEFYEDAMDLIKERDMGDVGYYFTDAGITFYLPPYEIAPYATGYVEIIVPFAQMEQSAQEPAVTF